LECVFCSLKDIDDEYGFNEIIYEDNNILITYTVGMFVSGYFLVINKSHHNNFAQYLNLKESFAATQDFISKLDNAFGKYCYFEHGASDNALHGQSINHAHIHLIPCNDDMMKSILEQFDWLEIDSYDTMRRFCKSGYFFFEYENRKFVCEDPADIQSQWIRRKVYEKLNVTDKSWDWKQYKGTKELLKTKEVLKSLNKSV